MLHLHCRESTCHSSVAETLVHIVATYLGEDFCIAVIFSFRKLQIKLNRQLLTHPLFYPQNSFNLLTSQKLSVIRASHQSLVTVPVVDISSRPISLPYLFISTHIFCFSLTVASSQLGQVPAAWCCVRLACSRNRNLKAVLMSFLVGFGIRAVGQASWVYPRFDALSKCLSQSWLLSLGGGGKKRGTGKSLM